MKSAERITDRELEYRLIYSIIVAGKSAKFATNVVQKLFEWWPFNPFEAIRLWDSQDRLEKELKAAKTGNYKKLISALKQLAFSGINLRTCSIEDLEKFPGIGPKTSRFFIMWTRPNVRYAVLDTHILKWLGKRGHKVPKSTPVGKRYKEIEDIFLNEADELELSPQELDTAIWKSFSGSTNWSPEREISMNFLA